MTTVEAAHIVYGCVQVRFGLSAQNIWTEEDGDFKYHNFYCNNVKFIVDLPDDDREKLFKEWNMKLFNNEDGHDVARDDVDESMLSSTHEGGSDLACLRTQMAAHNAAVKASSTDLERPAVPPTVAHPASAQEHSPPRTPLPSSPACIISTPHPVLHPRPVPRPIKTPAHLLAAPEASSALRPQTPLASSSACNILASSPAKTMLDSQADGSTSDSELTETDEEEPQ
ncbi:hypothetical protein BDR07DRAFT_1501830 [Suillus spraguei]|nr:hypothetical protein BDR07DRAFT_1501830 [Suillus spraguei]